MQISGPSAGLSAQLYVCVWLSSAMLCREDGRYAEQRQNSMCVYFFFSLWASLESLPLPLKYRITVLNFIFLVLLASSELPPHLTTCTLSHIFTMYNPTSTTNDSGTIAPNTLCLPFIPQDLWYVECCRCGNRFGHGHDPYNRWTICRNQDCLHGRSRRYPLIRMIHLRRCWCCEKNHIGRWWWIHTV